MFPGPVVAPEDFLAPRSKVIPAGRLPGPSDPGSASPAEGCHPASPGAGECGGNDVEPVEKVFAEAALGQHLLKVLLVAAMRRKSERVTEVPPILFELLVFDDAKQFGLHLEREIPKLIQEHGPVFREFEFPRFACGACSGERSFLVAEEF